MKKYEILAEERDLFRVVPLKVLRRTPGVVFDLVPVGAFSSIDGIDRVLHEGGRFPPAASGTSGGRGTCIRTRRTIWSSWRGPATSTSTPC